MSNSNSAQAPGQNKQVTIIVNGRPKTLTEKKVSYAELVELAFPGSATVESSDYTVTYSNPHGNDGTLVEGQETIAKEGMIVNVTKTNRS